MTRRPRLTIQSLAVLAVAGLQAGAAPPPVEVFRLRTPDDAANINQTSDLCWGRLGERYGLWTCCDRNGLDTAGRIYFFSPATLGKARDGGKLVADDQFTIVPPPRAWEDFARTQKPLDDERIEDVRKRIIGDSQRSDEPYLDLEAMTIAPSPAPPHDMHLFVVSEEPFSTILELSLQGAGSDGKAELLALYAYHERDNEHGTARNDGLEGLAYAGQVGSFYFAEEGTRDVKGRADALLFFLDPRLGLGRLRQHDLEPDSDVSDALTTAVRRQRKGDSQTLNGIFPLPDGRLLVLDRNGAWILRVDPKKREVQPWINLYDMDGQDLRKVLAHFPRDRHMPYVSIEGLALDDAGDLWLVDDPAMPEGFRESAMLRIRAADLPGASAPSSAPK